MTTETVIRDYIDIRMSCYLPDEWADFVQRFTDDYRGRKRPNLNELACSECSLSYQRDMLRQERCRPVNWAVTPLARAFRDEDNDDDQTFVVKWHRDR
jgi:hypothetical protein